MIPKIIHYCWFGGNLMPESALKCIESWKIYCPDYEIIKWDETNFDINITRYSKEAASVGKWAFVADVMRFYTVYNYGGIYLDTDVELLKPLDDLLNAGMYIGFQDGTQVNSRQGFGAIKNHWLVKRLQDVYTDTPFIYNDGALNIVASPAYTSKVMLDAGFVLDNTRQTIEDVELYPSDYFSPKDWCTTEMVITPNTYSIHHYAASWWSDEERQKHEAYLKRRADRMKKFIII